MRLNLYRKMGYPIHMDDVSQSPPRTRDTPSASSAVAPGVFTYRFHCVECGKCCRWPGQVHLGDRDITRLAQGLNLPEDDFIDRHTDISTSRRGLRLLDKPDGSCVFLENNRCSVYIHRPEQCRRYPFSDTSHAECPGLRVEYKAMGAGRIKDSLPPMS